MSRERRPASRPDGGVVVVGAGAVGLVLAGRLAAAGVPVRVATRRPEVARSLLRDGVCVEDPATGRRSVAPVAGAGDLDAVAGEGLFGAPVLLCGRRPEVARQAAHLAARTPSAAVFCAANGIGAEGELAGWLPRVGGVVVRPTCTLAGPTRALTTGRGRLVVGVHRACRDPEGSARAAERLAGCLRAAGFDVGLSGQLEADRLLKLCVNLMSTPNALVRRDEHRDAAFVEVKVRLLEEAGAALAAGGRTARSCDGRDRDLGAEIRHLREGLARGTSARDLPLTNAVWSGLREGRPVETDVLHERVVAWAEAAGLAAPVNRRCARALAAARRERRAPGTASARDLLGPG